MSLDWELKKRKRKKNVSKHTCSFPTTKSKYTNKQTTSSLRFSWRSFHTNYFHHHLFNCIQHLFSFFLLLIFANNFHLDYSSTLEYVMDDWWALPTNSRWATEVIITALNSCVFVKFYSHSSFSFPFIVSLMQFELDGT